MSRDLDTDEMAGSFDQPPKDSRERAEADWLLARERGLSASPPSAETAKDYEELEHMFATLPEAESDESWHDEVLKKAMAPTVASSAAGTAVEIPASRPRRPWWKGSSIRWASGGLAMAGAAAILFVAIIPRPDGVAEIAMAPTKYEFDVRGERRPSELTARGEKGELRIFRKASRTSPARFFARCVPATEQCKDIGEQLAFTVSIAEPGIYIAVSVEGPINVEETATMEEFRQAAKKQGLHPLQSKEVERK